jgi:hypothetical protein
MQDEKTYPYDVFISYRWITPDQEWVRKQLYPALVEAGLKVCLDVEDFVPGRDLILEMERAGLESRHVLCVISPEYFEEGRMVEFESLAARRRDPAGRNSFLIPLIFRDTEIPERIRGLIPLSWTDPQDHRREWKKLLRVLNAMNLEAPPPLALPSQTKGQEGEIHLDSNVRSAALTGAATEGGIEKYLEHLVTSYEKADWVKRSVELKVAMEQAGIVNASEALLNWAKGESSKPLFLVGDFGSGKTWALRRLAHDLAKEALQAGKINTLPLFVSLNRINLEASISGLKGSMGEWAWLLDAHPSTFRYLFLFDGLDEIGLSPKTKPEEFLKELISVIPRSARYAVSCRSQAFQQRRSHLLDSGLVCEMPGSDDPTDWAISVTLDKPVVYSLAGVDDEDADTYLRAGPAAAVWDNINVKESYYALSRQPVMLRLLEQALPRLAATKNSLTPPELYRVALETWLRRDTYCRLLNQSPEKWLEILLTVSGLMFPHGKTTPKVLEKYFGNEPDCREVINSLVNADILDLDTRGALRFSHQSLFEYFFALLLYSQLEIYEAQFLAAANLVYAYPVNRFLVPLLMGAGVKDVNSESERISNIGVQTELCSGGVMMSCPVTTSEFLDFMAESGWRRNTGFGLWTILGAADGTVPTAGIDLDNIGLGFTASNVFHLKERADLPVVGISWYDAWQFCRWVGGRLPSVDELEQCEVANGEVVEREWTATWFNEPKSLMLTLSRNIKERCGLNPDIRLDNLGFRVIFPRK